LVRFGSELKDKLKQSSQLQVVFEKFTKKLLLVSKVRQSVSEKDYDVARWS